MGTANGPEQRQLRPEPAGRTQPCQHSDVGVQIRNVQGRGRGRKITPSLAPAPVPFLPGVSRVVQSRLIWFQNGFLLSKERVRRSQSKYHSTCGLGTLCLILRSWWARESQPYLPLPSCKHTVPWYSLSSRWGKASSPTVWGSEVKLQISPAEKRRDACQGGKRQRSPDGPPGHAGYLSPLNNSAKTKAVSPEEPRDGRCSPGLSLGWC